MKKSKNHALHLSFILMMLVLSGMIVQIPVEHHGVEESTISVSHSSSVCARIQSLVYTGNIDSIVDGIARYFSGSMQEALTAFLSMPQSPLADAEKSAVLFGLVYKLRKNEIDQSLVCKHLVDIHPTLSSEPLLYAAVKSSNAEVVKDIVRYLSEYKRTQGDALVFDAFRCAIQFDDLKSIEKMYMAGAHVTKHQASKLLKTVVCENKKIEMAKFFIERTYADPFYVDEYNKSLLSYALSYNNTAFIQAVNQGKKDKQGFIVAFR